MTSDRPGMANLTAKERMDLISQCGLCIGCGLCESVVGSDHIRMIVTEQGYERPVVVGELSDEAVNTVYDICPGVRVDGLPDKEVDAETRLDEVWGPYYSMVYAYSANPDVRYRAATGGALSALSLFPLDAGRVEFVLHVRASTSYPTFGERHLSFDAEDVLEGSGSRYGPASPLLNVRELLDRGKPFAFVAKPCDVAARRNYARHDKRVDKLVRYWLTMVCGGYFPPPNMGDYLRQAAIEPGDVPALRYRGYGCPGSTRIETRDGRVIERNYLDMWGGNESTWSLPFRCKVCPDGIGEAADIVAADTWPGGNASRDGQEGDQGTNALIIRTRAGVELVSSAVAAGYLAVGEEMGPAKMGDYQPHQVTKKYAAWARHAGLRTAGQLFPKTERLRIRELAQKNSLSVNLSEARGTRRRVREGRTREPAPRNPMQES